MDEIEEFSEKLGEAEFGDPQMNIPPELPVLPLRDIVIYPFMIVPLFVSRDRSIKAIDEALSQNRMILLVSQKDLDKEEPTQEDLYKVGTVAVIMRMLKLPDGRIRILIQGLSRARVESVVAGNEYVKGSLVPIPEALPPANSLEFEALIRNVRSLMERAANLGKNISPEVLAIIANLDDAGRLADLSASNLELKVEDAQSVLDIFDPILRLRRVNDLLSKEIDVLTVQQEINTQARADIDRSQREYFLRQQLKAIQSELGEGNELFEEIEQYRDKILKAKMPQHAEEESLRQLKKLERMHPDTAETATLRNWLDIMTDLPWSKSSKDNLNLKKAERILDEDHYGLERVKERMVEALAVRKLMEKPKGSILCLVGPPGVGKCITEDSLILTSRGLVEFRDLIPSAMKDDSSLSFEIEIFGINGLEKTSHIYFSGDVKTLKLKTSSGFSLEGTPHHPILTASAEGLVWKTLSQLDENDFVAIGNGANVWSKKFQTTEWLSATATERRLRTESAVSQIHQLLSDKLGRNPAVGELINAYGKTFALNYKHFKVGTVAHHLNLPFSDSKKLKGNFQTFDGKCLINRVEKQQITLDKDLA